MERRIHFRVKGRVQGVSYRASARETALEAGLAGWVRNLEDGDVEGEAEGDAATVARFVDWLRQGPPGARVDELHIHDQDPQGARSGFAIVR